MLLFEHDLLESHEVPLVSEGSVELGHFFSEGRHVLVVVVVGFRFFVGVFSDTSSNSSGIYILFIIRILILGYSLYRPCQNMRRHRLGPHSGHIILIMPQTFIKIGLCLQLWINCLNIPVNTPLDIRTQLIFIRMECLSILL